MLRIQIAPEDEKIQVCQTFISNTHEVFILIQKGDKYIMKSLDLDKINPFEHEEVNPKDYKF